MSISQAQLYSLAKIIIDVICNSIPKQLESSVNAYKLNTKINLIEDGVQLILPKGIFDFNKAWMKYKYGHESIIYRGQLEYYNSQMDVYKSKMNYYNIVMKEYQDKLEEFKKKQLKSFVQGYGWYWNVPPSKPKIERPNKPKKPKEPKNYTVALERYHEIEEKNLYKEEVEKKLTIAMKRWCVENQIKTKGIKYE